MKTNLNDILKNGTDFKLRRVSMDEWCKRFKRVKSLQKKIIERKNYYNPNIRF